MSKLIADISHHKKVTDWGKFLNANGFVITKATEGKTFVDPMLKKFIVKCEAAKKPYWLYSFVRRGTELEGAKFLVKTCKDLVGPYFQGYALDIETGIDGKIPTVTGVKKAIEYLNSLGGKCMLYTMYAQYTIYKDIIQNLPSNCAWWEARYGSNNGKDTSNIYPCHSKVDLHQYTSRGTVPGIKPLNAIDLNKITHKNGKDLSWFTENKKTIISTEKKKIAKVITKKDPLNLRATATKKSKIIEKIPKGAEVEVLQSGNKWTRVSYCGKVGYCASIFLQTVLQ